MGRARAARGERLRCRFPQAEELLPRDSVLRGHNQHSPQQALHVIRDGVEFAREIEVRSVDLLDEALYCDVFVGAAAEEHLIETDSQGPDVRGERVGLT